MWLLGIYVKSLHAYRKALGVDKYEWANKAEVGTLLSGAYPKTSRTDLQDIVRRFEKTGVLPPFNLIAMQEIVCTTDGIQVLKREKFNTQSASYTPKLGTSQYKNQAKNITSKLVSDADYLFGHMRDASVEERNSIKKYLDSKSKDQLSNKVSDKDYTTDITPFEFKRKLMQIHNSDLIDKTDFSSLTVPQMEAILQVIDTLNERKSSQDNKK